MSFNLSLLPPDEKNKIELDKQASFLVWKLREAKSGPEAIEEQLSKINDADEKSFSTGSRKVQTSNGCRMMRTVARCKP